MKQEIKRCNATDLASAMSVAETMVEFKTASENKSDFHLKDKGVGGGDRNKSHRPSGSKPPTAPAKVKAESCSGEHKKKRFPIKCFLCDGSHFAHDCTSKGQIASLVKAKEVEEKNQKEKEETRLGLLRILNSIKSKKTGKPKGLMFAEVMIGDTTMSALVDTGASDLFISEEAAKKLNLRVVKGTGWLMTMNSK